MKTIRLLLFLAALAASSVRADEAAPMSAPYETGQLSAFLEAPAIMTNLGPPRIIRLRDMAAISRTLAYIFRSAGDIEIAFYFEGRASVFQALAELYPGL